MSHNKPLVSFLVLCYNHEDFVSDCLNSIINQSYTEYEVIICDDCSVDASVPLIQKQKKKFDEKNIRFVVMENQENQGITKNINRMLKEAHGKYIKIFASDDILFEEYLSEMVPILEGKESLQFVFSNGIKIREEAHYPVKKEYETGLLLADIPDYKFDCFQKIYMNNFIPAPTTLFRKSVLEELGGYDESIGIEDLEMSLRILQKYPHGAEYYQDPTVYYRINANSVTSTKYNKGLLKRAKFMYMNRVAIAKKYKNYVSRKMYWRKILSLRLAYIITKKNAFLHRWL